MGWKALISYSDLHGPDMLGCSDGALALLPELLSWSAEHLTDGFITRRALPHISIVSDPVAAMAELVDVGRVEETDDGWHLVGFLDTQTSADEARSRQAGGRKRTERWRRHSSGDHGICDPKRCSEARDASRDASQHASKTGVNRREGKGMERSGMTDPDLRSGLVVGQGRLRGTGSADAPPDPTASQGQQDQGQYHKITVDWSGVREKYRPEGKR